MDISKKTIKGYIVNNIDFKPKSSIENNPVSYMAFPARFHLDFDIEKSQYRSISIFLKIEDALEHQNFIESHYGETAIIKEVDINIV
jgi:hypothetical protein